MAIHCACPNILDKGKNFIEYDPMPGDFTAWGTNEWDDHVQKLLKLRYSAGQYQQIPAETHGDCGLEGYVPAEGVAYQCYSAQGWSNYKQLYEKQRGKITADIGTFLSKEKELLEILGDTKIKVWNLVVPCWMNKDLIKHAKVKEKYVRSAKPKHIASDFGIAIITGSDFSIEAQMLANAGLVGFDAPPHVVDDEFLAQWLSNSTNLDLVSNLSRKSEVIGASKPAKFVARFRSRIAKNYIAGSVVLNRLEKDYPDTFKRVVELKEQKENDLDTETLTNNSIPSAFFDETLQSFQAQLTSTPGLTQRSAVALAHEAVADWLLRCPLDF